MILKIKADKRSIALWISFILLVLFAIILSVFTMAWVKNRAKESGEELEKVLYHDELCDKINIWVNASYTTSTINLSIENIGTWRIDRVLIEFFNDSLPTNDQEYDCKLRSGYSKVLKLSKQGNLIYITPIVRKDSLKIICENKKNKIELG